MIVDLWPAAWLVLVPIWAGINNALRKHGEALSAREFFTEVSVAGFSGALIYFVCEWQQIGPPLQIVLVALGAQMGTRTVFLAINRFFPEFLFKVKDT